MKTIKAIRQNARRQHVCLTLAIIATMVLTSPGPRENAVVEAQARSGCAADPNPIACENLKTGHTDWDISGVGDPSIQGFATDMSVNIGGTIDFKIDTDASAYTIDIYRLGYYSGAGARKVATVSPSATLPQNQPSCLNDPATGLFDCGNWQVSASWPVPMDTVSGIHIARLARQLPTPGESHIVFIVRDDTRQADIQFQTADTTWQAYNRYGGASTYCVNSPNGFVTGTGAAIPGDEIGFSSAGTAYACPTRAVKVSYNRPFDTRVTSEASWLFNAEYPMLRFLEANGYSVKYWSGVDTDRRGADLSGPNKPKIFLSVGHDEYWSGTQRTRVEAARNAGVNLAFMSGNELYWKHRWEPSIAPSGTSHRTLVTYKETLAGQKIDPATDPSTGQAIWTGTWRDTRFSPPADGGRPENALIGSIWTVNSGTSEIVVPAAMKNFRLWRNTRVADMTVPSVSLGSETLGYEWGEALENGFQPAGLVRLSSTTVAGVEKILDFGTLVGPGTATHTLTLYRHNSGALVFGASTVQWAWGLDAVHSRGSNNVADQAIQQATINLFADMGNVQPALLIVGADPSRRLVTTAPSTDIFAPVSTITSPAAGSTVESGSTVMITGTATDSGGGQVGGVEVSVNGGVTWNAAVGKSSWTFNWTPGALGTATIRTRAIDDGGNLESASVGISVTVGTGVCPCPSLWTASTVPESTTGSVPGVSDFADNNPYELGVKFRTDIDGFISGVRFYKGAGNTGTHLGNLWTASGQLLATATFLAETPTGWQQVLFDAPVPVMANTVYVASYHTNVGHYAVTPGFLVSAGKDSPPLHVPASGEVGGNGVFAPGGSAFPTNTTNGNYYWIDVVFSTTNVDQAGPVISNIRQQAIDGSRLEISWSTNEEASSRIDSSTDPAFPPAATLTVSNGTFKTAHRLTVAGLLANTTYYFRVTSADPAGNLVSEDAPSFTLPGPTLRDTADEDFNAGMGAGAYVSATGNGELILAPALGAEFSGTSLPAGWKSTPWDAGGISTVGNGILRVDGARFGTCTNDPLGNCTIETGAYPPGRSIEFVATFTGDESQHAGLAVTFESGQEPWAIFSTLSGGNLYARTNTGTQREDILLGGTYLGAPHRYRINWNADGTVSYVIDGALVHTSTLVVTGLLRPVAASDFSVFGGAIFVDWVRLTPYAAAGVFESRVFDAQASVNWKSILWTASQPAGTTLDISVRGGNTATPDGSWSSFAPVAGPGQLDLSSQYIQYRVDMTTTDLARTPALEDIIITTGETPVAVNDAFNAAQNRSRTFPASGPGSLTFNDTDGDSPNDALRVVAVTAPSHGTIVLNLDGSVRYTPTLNYNGDDTFSYTVSDGLLISSAAVSITVTFVNQAPEAGADFYNVNEDTPLSVPAQQGLLANDIDVEGDALRAVLISPPAFGMLALSPTGSFSYTPAENWAGAITFAYKANDGDLDSPVATVQIVVNQVNDPPNTRADAYTAVLGQELVVAAPGVLGNDLDVEIGGTLRAQLTSMPTSGVLSFSNTGAFTYTANSGFLGIDTFKYRSVDEGNLVSLAEATVTLTVAIKAVSQAVESGATVETGGGVSADDPLRSAVTTPTPATVSIAQGVISGSQSPSGYTFLNQQVNITVTDATGTEVTATAANPLVFTFEVDLSLIPAGQNEQTFEIFRNGVRVPNCLGQTTIPSANLDPCVSDRQNGNKVKLTILTTHASHWNMGVTTASLGDELLARNDGPFWTNFQTPLVQPAPGVLGNDFGSMAITAELSGTPEGGTADLSLTGGFTFTPNAGHCGPASFKYKAHDGAMLSGESSVAILVNCSPLAGADTVTVLEDSGANAITVLSNDSDPDPAQTLRISAVTQGTNGTVVLPSGGMWLTYAPNAAFYGSDSFTYTVEDNRGGTATGTVNVTVTNVNDAPSFTKGADQTVLEDAAAQSVAGWATNRSASEGGQALDFIVANDNNGLFAAQPVIAPDGTLSFTPAPHANGMATVTVRLHDDGGTDNGGSDTSAAQPFTIAVTTVNDAPSFTKGANQAMFEDTGAQTVTGWATGVSAGPPDESGQALSFSVTIDNSALFSVPPAVGPGGTLTYDPAPNANGVANVTVTLGDNGGTANGGVATSGPQVFTITLNLVNDAPSFTKGADQTVFEDAGPHTVAGWASPISAGPSDETTQALDFIVTNTANGLFAAQPAIGPNGTLTFTPAPNANGTATVTVQLHDDGGTANGGSDTSAAQMFTITVSAVNDAPSFVKGLNQTIYGNPGAQTVANWATAISAGPGDIGQALTFLVTNTNNALFSGQPALASNGTLSYTPAANAVGTATVTVALQDNGGTANGGSNSSAPQTFTITRTPSPTTTTVTSSRNPTLFAVPLTLKATVATVVAGSGVPTGTVTFKRGTTTIGTAGVVAGVATLTTSTLAVGTHAITAVYGGATMYVASTSPALSQQVTSSGKIQVSFKMYQLLDDTRRPKVRKLPVANAEVRVFTRRDACTDGFVVSSHPRKWGRVYDGLLGPNDPDPGCPILGLGTYVATGLTDAAGNVTIVVPPTDRDDDYVVIARTMDYDVTSTTPAGDALYSGVTILRVQSNQTKQVRLDQVRLFNGKYVNGYVIEELGSYLAIVQPEFMEWTEEVELYPFILDAEEGDWGVTTTVTPPEGFEADVSELTATVENSLDAVQFTVTDVGSDWTATEVKHVISHDGTVRIRTSAVPMFDRKPKTLANPARFIAVSKVTIDEAGGSKNAVITVRLSNESPEPISVEYITTDGTALAASDYTAASGTLTFAPGTTSGTITIPLGGNTPEADGGVFYVDLSNPAGGTLTNTRGVVHLAGDGTMEWSASTAADLRKGAVEPGAYVAESTDGEIILAPAIGVEFSGAALPAKWTRTESQMRGVVQMTDGTVRLDGAAIASPSLTSPGRSLEFAATFSQSAGQSAGLSQAQFFTRTNGSAVALYTRTASGPDVVESEVQGDWLKAPHVFRIEWTESTVGYWIDGKPVAAHAATLASDLATSLVASDVTRDDGLLAVDWMRLAPFADSGTYTSTIVDGGAMVDWAQAAWTAQTPAGTSMVVRYRTGNSPKPDESWTVYTEIPVSGAQLSGSSRYLQFSVQQTTTDPGRRTPAVEDVRIRFKPSPAAAADHPAPPPVALNK